MAWIIIFLHENGQPIIVGKKSSGYLSHAGAYYYRLSIFVQKKYSSYNFPANKSTIKLNIIVAVAVVAMSIFWGQWLYIFLISFDT